jgi:hypothetical protein
MMMARKFEDVKREIIEGFRMLKEADERIGHVWKLPNPYDCIRYAVTECAEAINDQIVLDSPDHARNNPQTPDVNGEMRDCGMMVIKYFLARGLGEDYLSDGLQLEKNNITNGSWMTNCRLSDVMNAVASAYFMYDLYSLSGYYDQTDQQMLYVLLRILHFLPDNTFLFLLKEKLDRTEQKVISGKLYIPKDNLS